MWVCVFIDKEMEMALDFGFGLFFNYIRVYVMEARI